MKVWRRTFSGTLLATEKQAGNWYRLGPSAHLSLIAYMSAGSITAPTSIAVTSDLGVLQSQMRSSFEPRVCLSMLNNGVRKGSREAIRKRT
jgi:hypothetical protein